MLPGSSTIVLLVLGSAAVGAASSSPAEQQRRLPVVALYLSAGQVLGHYLLVLASSHPHGSHWSVPMVAAHALAALGAAALICSAARLFGAIAAVLWQLVVVLIALRGAGPTRRPGIPWWAPGLAARTLAGSGRATRGPPFVRRRAMSSSLSKPDAAGAPAATSPRRTVLPLIRRLHFYAGVTVTALRAEFNWQRPQLDTAPTVPGTSVGPVDLDGVVLAAGGSGVAAPVEITLTVAVDEAVGVAEIDEPYRLTTDAAAVDPSSLRVTGVLDYDRDYSVMAKLADWGIRMHMGLLFGWLNQLLLLGIAVALVTVIVRGYRMWWQRRPTRGSDLAVGRPPARGGIRRLHPVVLVAGAVTTVAVGWFLPLLGISLAGFLLVDRVAAYRTRAHTNPGVGLT